MDRLALTIQDAVAASGLSRSSLYMLLREGKLPARKSGKRTLILVEDLERYLKGLPVASPGEAAHCVAATDFCGQRAISGPRLGPSPAAIDPLGTMIADTNPPRERS